MITPLPKQALISENLEFAIAHAVGDQHVDRKIYENSKEKQRNYLLACMCTSSLMENFNQ
jgi:hypothetical protein